MLGDLAAHLPAGSAVHRTTDPDWPWDARAMLLAHVVDLLALALWQNGGGKGPKPKPLPRPGVNSPARTIAASAGFEDAAEFDAWLAARRAARSQTS